jgi:hypothetical protein
MGWGEWHCHGLACCGGGGGEDEGGGLEGGVAQVQFSFVGKYGMVFSG